MAKRILVTVFLFIAAAAVPYGASLKDLASQTLEQKQVVPGDSSNAWFETSSGGEDVKEEFHQTYPLSPTGRVVLENLNGGVKIAVWDRSEIQVDAVKRASTRERLAEATIDITATADAVRIRTRYPNRNQHFSADEKKRHYNPATVDYTLTVPRQARLESIELVNGSLEIVGAEGDVNASSVNGRVVARGLAGDARLVTVNGNLEATFSRLNEGKAISLNSVNGNVALIIPSNANAVVRADTVHGSIANDFGLDVRNGDYVGHELYGQIGNGGTRIKLGNVNGGIQIRRSQDGAQLSVATDLLATKDKDKDKDKEKDKELSDAIRDLSSASAEIAAEAREAAKEALAEIRIDRQARAEIRREVDRELAEAQREIQRAQTQVAREVRRQMREQMRAEGRGVGAGTGRGVGGNRVTDRETKSFTVTGTPRVHVATFDGLVTVRGWDKSEVTYTATKRANNNEELKSIGIKTEQQASSVSIIAETADGGGSVDLEIFLPRNVSLHVSSGDGKLVLDGLKGDIVLRTGDGSIDVSNSSGALRMYTGDGPIKVSAFEGQLDARTGDGPISLDGAFTGLEARTGSGLVTLAVPAGANFILETNAEDVTNQGLNITEDAAPTRRMKRWKVGQGGKVFVVNTGDGRLVLQPR